MDESQIARNNQIKKKLLYGAAFIILILLLVGGIPRIINKDKIDARAAASELPRVTVMRLTPNTAPVTLILPSSAQAWHITPIWARTNGYLIRYLVDIGDVVSTGDLLAEIDTPEIDQELEQAEAELLNSIALLDIAKITTERWQKLWNKNSQAVTKQDVDQYSANYKAAQATVIANEKNVAKLRYQQQFKEIYAPFDGIIIKRNIDIGSLIYGNVNGVPQELFQIAQTHLIRFFVQVPQNYYTNIHEGLETEITVKELPGKTFNGKVSRYAKALDPTARTLLTEVDVENPEGILYAGLFGRVKFLMIPDTVNFIIPTTAIIIRNAYPHVALLDEANIVHLRQVQIGRDYGKQMEITVGLHSNERIIVIPSDQIQEGVKVNIIGKELESPQAPATGVPPA